MIWQIIWYILLILAALTALIFISRIRIDIEYVRVGEDDNFRIKVFMVRNLIHFETEIPAISLGGYLMMPVIRIAAEMESYDTFHIGKDANIRLDIKKIIRKLPRYIRFIRKYIEKYKSVIDQLISKTRCHKLLWKTHMGLGDPALTGMSAGLAWVIKGVVYPLFIRKIGKMTRKPEISVIPCFNSKSCSFEFHCIFDMRIGHIIIAGLKILIIALMNKLFSRRNSRCLSTQLKG